AAGKRPDWRWIAFVRQWLLAMKRSIRARGASIRLLGTRPFGVDRLKDVRVLRDEKHHGQCRQRQRHGGQAVIESGAEGVGAGSDGDDPLHGTRLLFVRSGAK